MKQSPSKTIFLFAGEQSGDALGADLITPLRTAFPHIKTVGVGGPLMRGEGLNPLLPLESFQTMGFIGVIKRLPFFIKTFFTIKRFILKTKPTLVILIDYPGFNLRLAKSLKKSGYQGPIIQYVCPSVWAWGKKRIPLIETYIDSLMTLLPFEPKLFNSNLINCAFVGHPLTKKSSLAIPTTSSNKSYTISIFPGSRKHEIINNLPLILETLSSLKLLHPQLQFLIVVASDKVKPLIQERVAKSGLYVEIKAHDQLQTALDKTDLTIATSGTITLEIALSKLPCIVVYYISRLDVLIAKYLFKIDLPHYSLPNIIANKTIYPELIGPHFTKENLSKHTQEFITSSTHRENTHAACAHLKKELTASPSLSPFSFLEKQYGHLLSKKD